MIIADECCFCVQSLAEFHPHSTEAFHAECNEAAELLARGCHFAYFFTDRDGTLKGYSCSYPSSIQPAYAGVIQVTIICVSHCYDCVALIINKFARRQRLLDAARSYA